LQSYEISKKRETGSHQGESRIEKQWHTSLEA